MKAFPRLQRARREAQEQRLGRQQVMIQRNALKDQRDRLAVAIAALNAAHSSTLPAPERDMVVAHRLEQAVALLTVCTDYDTLQSTVDRSYPQETQ